MAGVGFCSVKTRLHNIYVMHHNEEFYNLDPPPHFLEASLDMFRRPQMDRVGCDEKIQERCSFYVTGEPVSARGNPQRRCNHSWYGCLV